MGIISNILYNVSVAILSRSNHRLTGLIIVHRLRDMIVHFVIKAPKLAHL